MECGLVLDRIVGAAGAPLVLRGPPGGGGGGEEREEREEGEGEEDERFRHPSRRRSRRRRRRNMSGRELLLTVLSVFHLDSEQVVEQALESYRRVYGRQERLRQGDDLRRRTAVAFCVCNTLARLGIPRPPKYVAQLCEVPVRKLLHLQKSLGLSREQAGRLRAEEQELGETTPQQYVDAACAQLGIPFSRAGEAPAEAERVEWALHGRRPTVLAAAAIQLVLSQNGELTEGRRLQLCDLFNCRQNTVQRALSQWPREGE